MMEIRTQARHKNNISLSDQNKKGIPSLLERMPFFLIQKKLAIG
jgi:hypothetical protein